MLKNGSRRLLDGPATRTLTQTVLARQASTLPAFLVPAWATPQIYDQKVMVASTSYIPKLALPKQPRSREKRQLRYRSTSAGPSTSSNSDASDFPASLDQSAPGTLETGRSSSRRAAYYADQMTKRKHGDTNWMITEAVDETHAALQAIPKDGDTASKREQVARCLASLLGRLPWTARSLHLRRLRPVLAELLEVQESRIGSFLADLRLARGGDADRILRTVYLAIEACRWSERIFASDQYKTDPGSEDQPVLTRPEKRLLYIWLADLFPYIKLCTKREPTHAAVLLRSAVGLLHASSLILRRNFGGTFGFNLIQIGEKLLLHDENKWNVSKILQTLVSPEAAAVCDEEYDTQLVALLEEVVSARSMDGSLDLLYSRNIVKTAARAGLIGAAATLFRTAPGQRSEAVEVPEEAFVSFAAESSKSLAELASFVMGKALASGNLEEAERIARDLQAADGEAARTATVWQRKLEALLLEQKLTVDISIESFRSDLVTFLQEMFEADVPADAYFCCALLRGIASSHLELEDKARFFRQIYQAVPVDPEQSHWLTLEIAAAQSDLSLFEQAAKSGAQLPWMPSVEHNGLAALLSGPNKDQQTIYDRFTVLCTILRHQIYRKHWQAGVKTYKGLLEMSTAPALQKEVPQQALHGCFIRLISGLLAAKALQQSLQICQITADAVGADKISARVISRIIMAATSTSFAPRNPSEAQDRPFHLVPALRFTRQWAQARLEISVLAEAQPGIDEGLYREASLRAIILDSPNFDRLALAALHRLFQYETADVTLDARLGPMRELLETLAVLDSQISYRRWAERLPRQVDQLKLTAEARRRWEEAQPLLLDMIKQAGEDKAERNGQKEVDWWQS